MRLLHSTTDKSHFVHRIQQDLMYSAFLFRVSGTSGGTAVFLRDVGRMSYTMRGRSLVDMDFDMMHAVNNVFYGVPENTNMGSASSAYAASVLIPRSYFDDNVESVRKDDQAVFECPFTANLETNTASGFLAELYAIEEPGIQAYNMTLKQTEFTVGGATTAAEEVANTENIVSLFISDIVSSVLTLASSPINRIRYSSGVERSGEFAMAAGLAKTNMKNAIETAQSLVCEVFSSERADISVQLEDSASLSLTCSNAAQPQILAIGMQFNPNKLSETATAARNRLDMALRRKAHDGKKRTVNTITAMMEASK